MSSRCWQTPSATFCLVSNPITRLLFGGGNLPDSVRAQLESEGIVHREEGLRGSVTYRHYRAPGRRSNWRKVGIRAALVVTDRRLGVFVRRRPIVDIAFDDPRFTTLELRAEDGSLMIGADASVLNDRASGQITVRLRCADPDVALAAIRSRQP